MHAKGLTKDQYAMNHPAGAPGASYPLAPAGPATTTHPMCKSAGPLRRSGDLTRRPPRGGSRPGNSRAAPFCASALSERRAPVPATSPTLPPRDPLAPPPAGRIGKRLLLRVRDVMKTTDLPCCTPDQNGLAALVQLAVRADTPPCSPLPCPSIPRSLPPRLVPSPPRAASTCSRLSAGQGPWGACPATLPSHNDLLPPAQGSSKGSGCLLVLDSERRLLGTLSDGDLRRALAKTGEAALQLTVKELMNFKKPFPRTVAADMMARGFALCGGWVVAEDAQGKRCWGRCAVPFPARPADGLARAPRLPRRRSTP